MFSTKAFVCWSPFNPFDPFDPYPQFVDASPSGCCRSGQEPRDPGINNLEIRIERIERIERRRLQPEQ
jgi:hypothetical protein